MFSAHQVGHLVPWSRQLRLAEENLCPAVLRSRQRANVEWIPIQISPRSPERLLQPLLTIAALTLLAAAYAAKTQSVLLALASWIEICAGVHEALLGIA